MIVLKFGGTSVEDAAAFRRALQIVRDAAAQRPLVVVSAMAKTTAQLTAMGAEAARGELARARERLADVMARHRSVVRDLRLGEAEAAVLERIATFEAQILRLLVGIDVLRECTPRTRDHLATFGERMSSMILASAGTAAGLDTVLLDAFEIVITDAHFGRARPDLARVHANARARVRPLLEAGRVPVLQGYIGATAEGVPTTMGFEASDFTATLLGAALGVEEVQIWTDVSGMLSADNRVVAEAVTLPWLSFDVAEELANLGASVIHPDAVRPAALDGIPVRILNSRAPTSGDTLLSRQARPDAQSESATDPPGVRSVALLRGLSRLRLTPHHAVLPEDGFGRWVLDVLARHAVRAEASSGNDRSLALLVRTSALDDDVLAELDAGASVAREDGLVLVSVAGPELDVAPRVPSRALAALGDLPVRWVSQGPSPLSMSIAVPEERAVDAVRLLHRTFIAEGGTP